MLSFGGLNLDVLYYPEGNAGPVRDYLIRLESENTKAFSRLAMDLEVLGAEGPGSPRVNIRRFGGGLSELKRRYNDIQYRIFFVVYRNSIWLLHHLEKKSAKTPKSDMELARKRLKGVVNR